MTEVITTTDDRANDHQNRSILRAGLIGLTLAAGITALTSGTARADFAEHQAQAFETFAALDRDQSGVVTLEEFAAGAIPARWTVWLDKVRPETRDRVIAKWYGDYDLNGDGQVHLAEFSLREAISYADAHEVDVTYAYREIASAD